MFNFSWSIGVFILFSFCDKTLKQQNSFGINTRIGNLIYGFQQVIGNSQPGFTKGKLHLPSLVLLYDGMTGVMDVCDQIQIPPGRWWPSSVATAGVSAVQRFPYRPG